MAEHVTESRLRVSRRSLGAVGGGLILAAVRAPEVQADPKKPPPGRGGEPASPLARRGIAVIALQNGLVLVAGGMKTASTSVVQLYDPNGDSWFSAPPMNTPRAYHAAVLLSDGRVLVCGGRFTNVLASAEIYDPRREQWTLVAPMSGPRAEHGAVVHHGGNVLVTGGINQFPLASVELYDVGADAWRRL